VNEVEVLGSIPIFFGRHISMPISEIVEELGCNCSEKCL
jgi:hypothetical protein